MNQYLSFNQDENRYGIKDSNSNEWTNTGLHCGDGFQALINGEWQPVSIEYDNEWYLTGTAKRGNLENIIVKGGK